jgi:hypothetical protein
MWFAVAAAAANVSSFWISPFIILDGIVWNASIIKTVD